MKETTQTTYLSLICHIITVNLGYLFLIIERNNELDNSSETHHHLDLSSVKYFLLCSKPPLEKEPGKLLMISFCPDLK